MTVYEYLCDRIKCKKFLNLILGYCKAYPNPHENIYRDKAYDNLFENLLSIFDTEKTPEGDMYWTFLLNGIYENGVEYIYDWRHIEEFVQYLPNKETIIGDFREANKDTNEESNKEAYDKLYAFDLASAISVGTHGGRVASSTKMARIYKFCMRHNRVPNDFDR